MPTLDTLNKVQRINHHGYGFVSSKHRYKTMDYQKFLTHLSKVEIEEECIIHMRWQHMVLSVEGTATRLSRMAFILPITAFCLFSR